MKAPFIFLLMFVATSVLAANHRIGIGDDCDSARVCFDPTPTTITPGDSVTFFVYCDLICAGPANVVADDGSFRCARGCDGEGGDGTPAGYQTQWSFTRTFSTPGVVRYHDQASGAAGAIVVGPDVTLSIGPTFTGSWYDPAQSGHGIFLEILSNSQAFVGWFSFNPGGTEQAWFGGIGTITGNTVTFLSVDMPTGGRWIPNFDPTKIVHNAWGSMTLTFTDQDHGKVDFTASHGYGVGTMNLQRLTQTLGATATAKGIGAPGSVVTDGLGNVYFSSPNIVFKLDAFGALSRIAGDGSPGYAGDGGPAVNAKLSFPDPYPESVADPIDFSELVGALAADAAGNVVIADAYNNRIRKIDAAGVITTIAGDGVRGAPVAGDPISRTRFWWPQGIALGSNNNTYIADSNGIISRLRFDGTVDIVAGNNCGSSFLESGVCVPEQIAIDAFQNIFIPDQYCRVRKLEYYADATTIAGRDNMPDGKGSLYTCGYSGDGGMATKAALSVPYGVAIDSAGNLYIADTFNSCIRKVNAAGIISTFAGKCTTPGFAGDGGPGTAALLRAPKGVAVDVAGNVYIADTRNNRIRKVASDGTISTIAGDGTANLYTTSPTSIVGAGFTGAWYDPAQSGHGIFVEILPGNQVFLGWFTFDPAGTRQVWFGGIGSYSGNTVTINAVDMPTGGRWIPNFDPSKIVHNAWGSLVLTFTDCNHGRVDFTSTAGYGAGSMNLARLTQPAGQACP